MTTYRLLESVEARDEYGTFITAAAGDKVVLGNVTITITQEAKDCDCGKGVYCPLNSQRVHRG